MRTWSTKERQLDQADFGGLRSAFFTRLFLFHPYFEMEIVSLDSSFPISRWMSSEHKIFIFWKTRVSYFSIVNSGIYCLSSVVWFSWWFYDNSRVWTRDTRDIWSGKHVHGIKLFITTSLVLRSLFFWKWNQPLVVFKL